MQVDAPQDPQRYGHRGRGPGDHEGADDGGVDPAALEPVAEGQVLGQEVEIEFVDTCMCGDYHMTMDRSEKDALLYTPNAGLTFYEQMGLARKADRISNGGLERLGNGPFSQGQSGKEFDRLELF